MISAPTAHLSTKPYGSVFIFNSAQTQINKTSLLDVITGNMFVDSHLNHRVSVSVNGIKSVMKNTMFVLKSAERSCEGDRYFSVNFIYFFFLCPLRCVAVTRCLL